MLTKLIFQIFQIKKVPIIAYRDFQHELIIKLI